MNETEDEPITEEHVAGPLNPDIDWIDELEKDRARYVESQRRTLDIKRPPDRDLPSRHDWSWCHSCKAIREPDHACYRVTVTAVTTQK